MQENKALQDFFKHLEGRMNLCLQAKDDCQKTNASFYSELLPENYDTCYGNPMYSHHMLGEDLGQVASYLYYSLFPAYTHAVLGKMEKLNRLMSLLDHAKNTQLSKDALKKWVLDHQQDIFHQALSDNYNHENQTYNNIILNHNLNDLSYLYRFGAYITDNEIKSAQFLNTYPEDALDKLALSIVKAYVNGFKRDNKDITLRKGVRIIANVGQEQLTKKIIHHLAAFELRGYVTSVISTDFNKQFDFDHKFDKGLFLDEAMNTLQIETFKQAAEMNAVALRDYSGVLYIEKFGETPFSPTNHAYRIKLDDVQQKLHQAFQIEQSQTIEKYIPETERSFCIVAFPSPEIGEQFEDIFADTLKINQMDSDYHERIQQVIIDALDQGTHVHVKGYKGNKTDIIVRLQPLADPDKQTNFVNCVADVNIPVGEVFTSPQLKGTQGTLHVDTVYLNNFNYQDLTLEFEDGYVSTYTCSNFDDELKNQEYVRENLLFPHQSLPIGEFAIGTNTLAYVISEKYGIVDKLPILIVEKMGPHFAIGDTCFSWGEDNPVFNPLDGKEITARDNERSILRKEDVAKAYTNCHTDITIPYDSLEHITVIKADGKRLPIIEKGRFVLPGTEPLNEPFDQN